MNNNDKQVSKDLMSILSKVVENKIYGSVEIYFEGGRITQITQRIINKVDDGKIKRSNQNNPKPFEATRTTRTV